MSDRYALLVPAPRHAAARPGSFTLDAGTLLHAEPEVAHLVRRLLHPLNLPLAPGSAPEGVLSVRVEDGGRAGDGGQAEGYRLRVSGDGIAITATDLAGVRHAVQALKQLLTADAWRAAALPGRWEAPCGEIEDAPAVGWRGGMLDVSRHFMTKGAVLKYVDLLAMHRMNRLHLHLTDDQGWRVESRRHPAINRRSTHRPDTLIGHRRHSNDYDGTPHGGYYTLDDLAEISAYAAERGITVVPELDLPGHASALLAAFPELGTGSREVLGGWGISAGVLKPIPAAVTLVCELLDEVLEAVDTPYVHLGGDECPTEDWPLDPEVSAHMAALGITRAREMHGWFLREIGEHLATRGKRMIVWDEGFQSGGVRADSIVMCWRGDAIARQAAAAGYDVVRAPTYPTYFDYDQSTLPTEPLSIGGPITLEDAATFEVLPGTWSEEERGRVLGGQFQVWREYIPDDRHLDYMTFPRACAIAEAVWSGRPADFADLTRRLSEAHLARLEAAGCEYRPLDGPHPWQTGGTGRRTRETNDPHRTRQNWLAWRAQLPPTDVHVSAVDRI
ncbi:beta-N-acetylhexosaminidase [Nonomuraea sp. NPDC050547]|uniref:beta-N-acetylhexosaminidase n=1 Tax=Nonomuraea sp. NPDC050547 TaxID=3364368 RepID=UPI0037B8DCC1